jgi:hypothetical protein
MEMVVDANFLRDPSLLEYLRQSHEHNIVFTDYAAMECYKGDPLKTLPRSLEIACKFPERVRVLKGTRDIIRLQAAGRLARADLVDHNETAGFQHFCQALHAASRGNVAVVSQIAHLKDIAETHFNRLTEDAVGTKGAILQVARSFTPKQLTELRRTVGPSKEAGEVIIQTILLLAACLFRDHPDAAALPHAAGLPGSSPSLAG